MNSSNFECIIPIGETCNITFLMQNLKIKKETSLFEWFVSNNLRNITNVLYKIENKTDHDIIKTNGNHIYIEDSNIYSGHYKYEEFKSIYIRRRDRLINSIKSKNKILFIRFEGSNNKYNNEDIDNFINIIKEINPKCNEIKLLLISPNKDILKHECLINVFYDKHSEDSYCKGKEINDLFLKSLQTIGYNINDISNINFNEMSLI